MAKTERIGVQQGHDGTTVIRETRETGLLLPSSAEESERLEKLHPGFVREVLEMSRKQQDYAIERNRKFMDNSYKLAWAKLACAFILILVSLGLGFFAVYTQADWRAVLPWGASFIVVLLALLALIARRGRGG